MLVKLYVKKIVEMIKRYFSVYIQEEKGEFVKLF